jgi:hypothetical protein
VIVLPRDGTAAVHSTYVPVLMWRLKARHVAAMCSQSTVDPRYIGSLRPKTFIRYSGPVGVTTGQKIYSLLCL